MSFAHEPDWCKYFSISVSKKIINGAQKTSALTTVHKGFNDKFGQELQEHFLRYEYLLLRHFQYHQSIVQLFPDTAKINHLFCTQLKGPSEFRKNLELICPAGFLSKKVKKVQFSSSEMMFVASRFFYCNKVNKDTAIIPKICVGINGIKEMNSKRDLSSLESFVFEAIFSLMQGEKEPEFIRDFTQSIQKSMAERRKNIINLDDFLIQVRNDCFKEMEQNEALKKSLLTYYEKNKKSINFTIH